MVSPSQEARRNLILDALRDENLTTGELADKTNLNYNTCFKTCRELQEEGLIHYNGQVKEKSYIWSKGSKGVIPEFFDPAGNRKISALDIVRAYSVERTAASVKAANAFFEILEQLLNIGRELADGSSSVTEQDIKRLRAITIANHSLVKNLAGYYQQLLHEDRFWELDKLSLVGSLLEKSASGTISES
jgi:predicted transcriptional regulator